MKNNKRLEEIHIGPIDNKFISVSVSETFCMPPHWLSASSRKKENNRGYVMSFSYI